MYTDKPATLAEAQAPAPVPVDVEANGKAQKQARFNVRWKQEIDPRHADLVLILCALISGLCDSSAYNAWSCFVGMQTGNTIFLGLGASGQPTSKPFGWLKSLVSIASFIVGSFIFTNVCRRVGGRQRRVLAASFGIQAICLFVAAGLVEGGVIPHPPPGDSDWAPPRNKLFLELIPLFLVAFQAGGQLTSSRLLGFSELPTVVLTSVYYDIASDAGLIAPLAANVKRNRRIGGVVALLVGAIGGGWLSKSAAGMQSCFWIAGGLKMCMTLLWCIWKGKQ